MEFDFASLTYRPAAAVVPTANSVPAVSELEPEAIIELWQERSAIQETDNVDLIRWHRDNRRSTTELRRACELSAAADLALLHGDDVLPIIRPHLTKLED